MKIATVASGSALVILLLAGCTAAPQPQQSSGPPPAATLASLGIDDWPADTDLAADAPPAPSDLDAATYDRLVAAIAEFAELAARADDLRELEDPVPELASRLDEPFGRLIPLVAEQETAPRVTLLNYFGGGTDVTAGPVMQHVWNVRPADDGAGGTTITLQTWAAYEVTGDAGSGVIGVFREFSRTERQDGFTSASWETAGTDTCALAVEDAMVLDTDPEQLELLEAFVREGDEHVFAVREVNESITEEFKASCLDAG